MERDRAPQQNRVGARRAGGIRPPLDVGQLEEARRYLSKGLASRTRKAYSAGQRRYLDFCERAGITGLPLTKIHYAYLQLHSLKRVCLRRKYELTCRRYATFTWRRDWGTLSPHGRRGCPLSCVEFKGSRRNGEPAEVILASRSTKKCWSACERSGRRAVAAMSYATRHIVA